MSTMQQQQPPTPRQENLMATRPVRRRSSVPWDLNKFSAENSSSDAPMTTNQIASESKRLSIVREPSDRNAKTTEDLSSSSVLAATAPSSRPSKPAPETAGPAVTKTASAPRRSRISELLQTQRNGQSQPFEHEEKTAALQQNLTAMNSLMKREKVLNDSMKLQLETLAAELAKAQELYNEEKIKNEKITLINRKQKDSVEHTSTYLPGIHAPAVLQQQTQMEISYQRKVLSLENRCKDLVENNKKLLFKIQQLEKTEADADALMASFKQENARLATQVDSLSNTVASQSSLIIGLRTTLHQLHTSEDQLNVVVKKLDRSQIDLEATRMRERNTKDELEKLRVTTNNEKEALANKLLDFQRRVQQSDLAGDNADALKSTIRHLELEKHAAEEALEAAREACAVAETRMHQQEQMTNQLLLIKEGLDAEAALNLERLTQRDQQLVDAQLELAKKQQQLLAKDQEISVSQQDLKRKDQEMLALHEELSERLHELDEKNQQLAAKQLLEAQLQSLEKKEQEIDMMMQKTVDLQTIIDTLESANTKLQSEIQSLRQLSQDETVQALQLARQKAASQEALVLVHEEKRAIQEQYDAMMAQIESERADFDEFKRQSSVALDEKNAAIEDLLIANAALRDLPPQIIEKVVVQVVEKEVEVEVAAESSSVHPDVKARLEAEIERLRAEFEDVQANLHNVQAEYERVVTKKYKTESFHSQVRLLQNENNELSSKLERLCKDLATERALAHAHGQEIVELKSRVMDPRAIEMLRSTQDALDKTVSSLVEAETASESSFTCLQCMRLYISPMTLSPCGHTFCSSCLTSMGNASVPQSITCKECPLGSRAVIDAVFPNQALADLTARFIFRQQSLSSLTTMCLSLRNSVTKRPDAIAQ